MPIGVPLLLWLAATSVPPVPEPAVSDAPAPLEDIAVTAAEPRYVAPTRRDRIGRIWAPVYINGHGPLRLVLDTGASRSAIVERVAVQLGSLKVLARGRVLSPHFRDAAAQDR